MIAACGQMVATTIDQASTVWAAVERLAGQARQARADLLVLPEATYPAYWLESAERYMRLDVERSTAVLERFSKLAAKHSLWLVAGFVEEDAGRLFNSAAVCDRTGRLVGIARKNFLWACDHGWFTPGDRLSVFDTEFGRLGVLICADARVPEIPATLVYGGAGVIVQPTAWVNTSSVRRTYRNIQPDFLIRARAMEFGVPFVCSSKSGQEGSALEYVGQSQIVSAEGAVLAQAAIGGEELIVAEVAPASPPPLRIEDRQRQRLVSSQPPYAPEKPGRRCTIPLQADLDTVAAALTEAGARLGRLAVAELAVFSPARCLALDGAQVILASGRASDDAPARTRAAENRVFVISGLDSVHKVIDPDGTVAWREGDWGETLEIDLASADLKEFTPETNIWKGRRVECYRLGG